MLNLWIDWTDGQTLNALCPSESVRSFIYLDESCTPLLPVNTWLASYWSVSAALWPPIGQLLHLNLPCKQRRCHHNLQCKDMILVSILRIKDQVFDFLLMANPKAIKARNQDIFHLNVCPWWQGAGWPQDTGPGQQCCWGHSADPTHFIMHTH